MNAEDNEDLTLMLQKTRNAYDSTCVITRNAMKYAVTWISAEYASNSVSEFIPSRSSAYNCAIDENRRQPCISQWALNSWTVENSLNSRFAPVLDRRWEEFDLMYVNDRYFKKIRDIQNPYSFQINFSIRSKETHLFLCEEQYPYKSNCYWILIGGWSGATTGIRKCTTGKIPNINDGFPKGECYTLHVNYTIPNLIIDTTRWTHFILKQNYGNILLHRHGDTTPVINYTDSGAIFSSRYFISRSLNPPTFIKLHEYQYVITNREVQTFLGPQIIVESSTLCISMFLSICNSCTIQFDIYQRILGATNGVIQKSVIIESHEDNVWQEESIILNNLTLRSTIFFRVTTMCNNCENQFWAIDNFQLCSVNEIRVLRNSAYEKNPVCQIVATSQQVSYKNSISTKDPEIICPNGSFGRACTQCRDVLGYDRNNCDQTIMCSVESTGDNVCRCSPGFTGSACEYICPPKSYGFGCKEECGYCQYTPCNYVTGRCQPEACLSNFQGATCKIRSAFTNIKKSPLPL
ncbi:hypothetical protein FQA39_LY06989 [Lamprigera yunnana]|nr:hypothetical protein FQA39_LY06989 [Lamprigera yunnana]